MEVEETNVDSDSSAESSDEEQKEREMELRAERLETKLDANKYDYDVHIELIGLYDKLGDLNSLRAAYKRFHECYPLTPSIWLSWINNEIKLANTPQDVENVCLLFEEAVKDYLSVNLWQEYGQFSIGTSDLQKTRAVFEKGLNAAGLHVKEGSLLWDTLRELELAHLSLQTPETDEWREQVTRVNEIFRRQLSVPLLDMEQTYTEWKEWVEQLPDKKPIDPKPVEWGYEKALKTLMTYKPFEDRLLSAENDEDLHEIYKEYIEAQSDPSVKICLYERAIAQLCLNANLWTDYITFSMKLGELSLSVSSRALRNCPWSEDLWIMRLRVLENQKREEGELRDCFETGICSIAPPGVDLWLSYLEYVNRSEKPKTFLNKLFEQAINQVGDGDGTHKIARYQARLSARQKDMKTARYVWKNILHKSDCRQSASAWLEFINLERQYGEAHQLRLLFQRALNAHTDWPQFISEEWLMYERECGTLEDVMKCAEVCKTLVKSDARNVANDRNNSSQRQKRKNDYDSKVEREPAEKRKKIPEKVPPRSYVAVDRKKSVFLSNLRPDVNETVLEKVFPNAVNIHLARDRKGISRCYAYVQFDKEEEVLTALARDREQIDGRPMFVSECREDRTQRQKVFKYSSHVEANKLFVKGLPITHTKEDVEELFKAFKPVAVRLVIHKSGRSKGLAYVEFENEEDAAKALEEKDQTKIGEHVISVAISAPPPKPSKEQFAPVPAQHAKIKLQMPMVPRSVQVKTPGKEEKTAETSTSAKSNEDFRKMFFK